MTGIAVLLLAAAGGYAASRASKLPAIPFLIVGGFAASWIVPLDDVFLQNALVVGIVFLVFVAGIELNPERVRSFKGAALVVGVVQFVVLGAFGYGVARLLGFPVEVSGYLALALTASSTLVAVRVLQQRRQMFESFGRLVMGVLLFQDLAVILLIPVLTYLPDGPGAVLTGLGSTLVLVIPAYVALRWILPGLLKRMSMDEELLLLSVLGLLFVFLGAASMLGVPLVTGSFLAGVALSSFPVSGVVRGQLNSVGDFFTAVFFTALGANLGIPTAAEMGQALVLCAVVWVLTTPVVAIIAERSGFSARPAIFSGLLLSQTSEFSLVVGLQGVALGRIDESVFTVITLVTLVTMTATPLLADDRLSLWLMRFHPARGRDPDPPPPPEGHILLLGCGASGMPLLETLVIGPYPVLAIDDDPQIVARVREAGLEVLRGDAADRTLLRRAGADRARVVVSTVRRVEDNGAVLDMASGRAPVLVRVFDERDAAWVEAHGGTAVRYADAAAEAFLDWFDRDGWRRPDDLADQELEDVL